MTFFLPAWSDKRKRSAKSKRSPSPTRLPSRSTSSNHDSGYGSSTISSCATTTWRTSVIAHWGRNTSNSDLAQTQRSSRCLNEPNRQPCCSAPSKLSRHPACSAHSDFRGHPSSLSSIMSSPQTTASPGAPSGSSSNRFKAVMSRLLSRKKDHHYHQHQHHPHPHYLHLNLYGLHSGQHREESVMAESSAGSLFAEEKQSQKQKRRSRRFNSALFQRRRPRSHVVVTAAAAAASFETVTAAPAAANAPILVHPYDVAAPACYPGTGPVAIATKQQQLLGLQKASKRPCSASTKPSIQGNTTTTVTMPGTVPAATMLRSRGSRHLIPHHHTCRQHDLTGGGAIQVPQDNQACGTCPSSPPSLGFRHSSIDSLSLTSGSATAACLPSPTLSSSVYSHPHPQYQHQWTASSWISASKDDRSFISRRSMDEMEVVPAVTLSTAKAGAGDRRGSSQSALSSTSVASMLSPSSSPYSLAPERKKPGTRAFGQGYDISTMFKIGPLPSGTHTIIPSEVVS
ncbi:hypothetical protein BC939DRAFT_318943 [Gamsiella multidivaricata]|uniref:uncharacterized protein n=1 Tax=Gamsiella multidivaricata TaxID=101098 RepID=UPI00221FC2C9|nr:uncharacterized protein BC939DRAFT_318943 [Gamsiella multidivaricata]KAI7817615.1 hypothetical protein BC939DRAFT_318943 [Gamsiella multidivaricata]